MGTQPAEEGPEIAPPDRLGNLGHGAHRSVEELVRRHGPQRIGREIAPGAVIPMDVLEAATAVIGGRDAEELHHSLVPRPGQISDSELARQHGPLQPVAQENVRGIAHLVGIDPDEAPLNARVKTIEVLRVPGIAFAVEGRARERSEVDDEGTAAARLHLHEEGLALMHAHPARLATGWY